MTVPDMSAYNQEFDELISRLQERHPDTPPLTDYRSNHKDNIYELQTSTE